MPGLFCCLKAQHYFQYFSFSHTKHLSYSYCYIRLYQSLFNANLYKQAQDLVSVFIPSTAITGEPPEYKPL